MPSHATFWAAVGKKFAICLQILGDVDAVLQQLTIYAAAEPFHVLHMGPMSDDAVSNQLLGPHLNQAMPLFGLPLAKSLHFATESWAVLMMFKDN